MTSFIPKILANLSIFWG